MRIDCPFCGTRDVREFVYLGDTKPIRPQITPDPDLPYSGATQADAQSAVFDYVFMRDNIAGRHSEYWYHGSGCRSWLVVVRDTRTHEIFSVDVPKTTKKDPS